MTQLKILLVPHLVVSEDTAHKLYVTSMLVVFDLVVTK